LANFFRADKEEEKFEYFLQQSPATFLTAVKMLNVAVMYEDHQPMS